jgi:hypothetical protein
MNSSENNDELRKLAPKLSSIEKKEVFSIPANYFDSLSNQIIDKVSTDAAFEKSAVTNPFSVPENYFEELPLEIINRIGTLQAEKLSLGELFARALRPKYSLSIITACFAVFLCVKFFEKPMMLNAPSSTSENVFISETDVLGEVDESTLISVVTEESASVIKTDKKNAGDKNMEDYIINNNIDISDLAKEL